MGCDIHFVLERKFEDSWTGVFSADYNWPMSALNYEERKKIPILTFKSRNYEFFAALAGVRGEGPEPLGLPEDASAMVRMQTNDDGDDHSHSYCSLREFVSKRLIADSEDNAAELMRQKIEGSDEFLMEQIKFDPYDDATLDDFRVVFWFDN